MSKSTNHLSTGRTHMMVYTFRGGQGGRRLNWDSDKFGKPRSASQPPFSASHLRSTCPQYTGTMTETQVLLSLGHNQQTDRHGFVLPEGGPSTSSPGASSSKPDSSSGSSHRRSKRHERKWRKMLGQSGADFSNYLAKHPDKVKRRARKGIPDSLRGLAWQLLSGE